MKDFESVITKKFREQLFYHLGDMDKHDLITYKLYINRANIIDGDKFKPNESLGRWSSMDVYTDDGNFPHKDEVVMMSTNCGEGGYVIPYDYAVFRLGSKIDDSYRGLILSLNDITEQIKKLKKLKKLSTKDVPAEVAEAIKNLEVRKRHQIMFGGNDSMKMLPLEKS